MELELESRRDEILKMDGIEIRIDKKRKKMVILPFSTEELIFFPFKMS